MEKCRKAYLSSISFGLITATCDRFELYDSYCHHINMEWKMPESPSIGYMKLKGKKRNVSLWIMSISLLYLMI
jgi:hypothetical protein